jgi:hypothetical protein
MRAPLVFLAIGCSSGTFGPGPAYASGSKLCAPATGLQLASLRPSTALTLREYRAPGLSDREPGKLEVDHTVTGSLWPMRSPEVYALPDGRSLLYDGYNGSIVYVWEPRGHTLTELARGRLIAVPRQGWLVEQEEDAGYRLYDVDPDRTHPRLRELYHGIRGSLAGVLDGAIVFETEAAHTFTCISGPGHSTELPIALPAQTAVPSTDAIRDHRLLLIDVAHRPHHDFPPYDGATFDVAVSILDLDTGAVRPIGVAKGGWTRFTAVPHPHVVVRWADHDPAARDLGWHEDLINVVDPVSEHLQ